MRGILACDFPNEMCEHATCAHSGRACPGRGGGRGLIANYLASLAHVMPSLQGCTRAWCV